MIVDIFSRGSRRSNPAAFLLGPGARSARKTIQVLQRASRILHYHIGA